MLWPQTFILTEEASRDMQKPSMGRLTGNAPRKCVQYATREEAGGYWNVWCNSERGIVGGDVIDVELTRYIIVLLEKGVWIDYSMQGQSISFSAVSKMVAMLLVVCKELERGQMEQKRVSRISRFSMQPLKRWENDLLRVYYEKKASRDKTSARATRYTWIIQESWHRCHEILGANDGNSITIFSWDGTLAATANRSWHGVERMWSSKAKYFALSGDVHRIQTTEHLYLMQDNSLGMKMLLAP